MERCTGPVITWRRKRCHRLGRPFSIRALSWVTSPSPVISVHGPALSCTHTLSCLWLSCPAAASAQWNAPPSPRGPAPRGGWNPPAGPSLSLALHVLSSSCPLRLWIVPERVIPPRAPRCPPPAARHPLSPGSLRVILLLSDLLPAFPVWSARCSQSNLCKIWLPHPCINGFTASLLPSGVVITLTRLLGAAGSDLLPPASCRVLSAWV